MLHTLKKELGLARFAIPFRLQTIFEGGWVPFCFISLGSFLFLIISLIFFKAIYGQTNTIAGWPWEQTVVLVGSYHLITRISWMSYARGYWRMSDYVIKGELDYHILRPQSIMWLFVYQWNNVFFELHNVVIMIATITYGFINAETIISVPLYILAMIGALILHYSIYSIVITINFWLPTPELRRGLGQFLKLGEYPQSIYQGLMGIFLKVIMPVLLIFSIPVEIAFGQVTKLDGILFVLAIIFFYSVSRLAWHIGLRKYSSANG